MSQAVSGGGCWFRFGGNQVMRNVALARSLVSRGATDRAVVGLCAPNGHRAIWRRWNETKQQLKVSGVKLAELPAEVVANHHTDPLAITKRYLLEPPKD